MNIETLNVNVKAPEKVSAQKVTDTKTSLNKDSSFLDKLSIATANDTAVKKTETNKQGDSSISKFKSILTEEGFTQKEVDSIKNLKDLKELLISKASDGTLKAGVDFTNLLSSLYSLLGGKAQENFADIKKLCDSVLPQIKTAVSKAVIKAADSGNTVDALKSLQNEADSILSSNKQAIGSLKPEDLKLFKAALTNEVKNVLNNTVNNKVNNTVNDEVNNAAINAGIKASSSTLTNGASELSLKIQKEITSILDKYKSGRSVIKLNQVMPDVRVSTFANAQDLKGGKLTDKKSSDDSILNKLPEPDKRSSKIDKATNFMTQFTNTEASAKTVFAEKPTIDISNVNADIVKSLKFMQQGDIKNLTVKITPKELGDVIINLTMENGAMKASITASNKEAYNLINSNMADINAKLQNSNMAVQDLSLNIYNQDTTFFKNGSEGQPQQQAKQNNGNGKTAGILNAVEAIVNQSILNNNVNILA